MKDRILFAPNIPHTASSCDSGAAGAIAAPKVVKISSGASQMELAGMQGARRVHSRIPLDVAFREILAFVKEGLEASGEQWNDRARQKIVCTILIAAAKAGWLTVWERSDAA